MGNSITTRGHISGLPPYVLTQSASGPNSSEWLVVHLSSSSVSYLHLVLVTHQVRYLCLSTSVVVQPSEPDSKVW